MAENHRPGAEEKVDILLAVHIEQFAPLPTREDHRHIVRQVKSTQGAAGKVLFGLG